MSLDEKRVNVAYALQIAHEHYSKESYEHALRVMQYVADNDMIPYEYKDDCVVLAIMHDLIEDTKYTGTGLPDNIYNALKLLSKPKDMDYIEYIKQIKHTSYTNWRMCAYWVKLADMKDHLAQTETLTDKLKEKYLSALPYLL